MDFKKQKKAQMVEETKVEPVLMAKKDFLIVQNDFRLEIKKGDRIPSDIPVRFIPTLKTEGVI